MGFSSKQAGALLVMAACAATAGADEKTFEFSGFGTAGFAVTDTNKAEFIRDSQQTGVDKNGSAALDSLLGLQGTAHLTETISATAQVLLRRNNSADYGLDVPLAFVKDNLTSDVAVRLGRLPLPFFMVSDYRQVGYANTFIRPPQEVYGQAPLDSINGADVLYGHTFGPVELNAQVFYGGTQLSVSGVDVSLKRTIGENISGTWGPLTLRWGRMDTRLTITSPADQLIEAVAAAGFTDLANWLSTKDKPTSFSGWGATLDWHNVLLQGEYTKSQTGGFEAKTRGWYTLGGYRIQKFTPYAMYSDRAVTSERSDSTIPAVGPLAPLAAGVDALVHGSEQHSVAFGVRWDFHESMDLKLQVDRAFPDSGGGLFINVKPGFSGPVTIAALAVDFVF